MGTRALINQPGFHASARRKIAVRGGDTILLLAVIALVVFGLLMLYSASWDYSLNILHKAPWYLFERQLIWVGIGIVIAFILARFDYHHWQKLALPGMILTIALLLGVLLVNEIRLGATRTIYNGSLQPSEGAKLVTVIYLSVWLYAKREQLHDLQMGLIPLGMILGIIGGLIYLQPDLSATGTVLILGGLLFFLAGGDLRQITLLLIFAIIVGSIVIRFHPTGHERVTSYWLGLIDPIKSSYHVQRCLEAIVKGGLFGVGIGRGDTKLLSLPSPAFDSVFAVIAEELGLFGTLVILSLFCVLVWRGLVIARRTPDMLGSLLASGLVFWIGLEALINMAAIAGVLPFAGNALPFFSAGGSSMTIMLAAIGILLNISRQTGEVQIADEEWRTNRANSDLRWWNRRRRISRPRRSDGNEG